MLPLIGSPQGTEWLIILGILAFWIGLIALVIWGLVALVRRVTV